MILLLSFIVLLLWTVQYRYKWRRMYTLASKIARPETELPIIGVAHTLSGDTEDIMKTMQYFCYSAHKNDGIVRIWFNHLLIFAVTDPVDLEVVLKTCLEKDDLHRFLRAVIGNGTIFAPVPIWRRRRKVLVPVFSPKIVENFVEVFSEQSQVLVDKLAACTDGSNFSMWPYLSTFTLDSVCKTTMGISINAQSNPNAPFLLALNDILNILCKRIFHLWLRPEWLYKLLPVYNHYQECLSKLHNFTNKVIKKKREEIRKDLKSQVVPDHQYDLGTYRNKTFLDLLIQYSGGETGFTDVELREEVLTLTIAGTDTSAVAIGYTLMMLAKYPRVQEQVYQELYDVFEDSDRPLEKSDLNNLKYLERVVKETLRLFPPVPFIIRKVTEEIKLPSGRSLPAGSGVCVCIWGVHRDPKYWGPDAENFDPDRFLPERYNLKHACSFMPFSQGPRNCIGYQYALISIKTALSSILRRYRVVGEAETSDAPHVRVKLDIMMKAVNGYQVALEKRKHKTMNKNNIRTAQK